MYYNMSGDGFYNLLGYTWLRSGSNAESYIAWYMSAAGYKYSLRACTKQAVRPATHKAVGLSTTKTSSCHPVILSNAKDLNF